MLMAGLFTWKSSWTILNIFLAASLCGAFIDTVIDGITTMQ
jgi:hypothetical protein